MRGGGGDGTEVGDPCAAAATAPTTATPAAAARAPRPARRGDMNESEAASRLQAGAGPLRLRGRGFSPTTPGQRII